MAQASQCRSNRTLWMGFAVGAPQCASTIDETTTLLSTATCKILDKEVGMNHYQYYERELSAWMENMSKSKLWQLKQMKMHQQNILINKNQHVSKVFCVQYGRQFILI